MTPSELAFIKSMFYDKKHALYHYYKDKYALDLLKLKIKEETSIADLKKSHFGFLTQKKTVSEVLAKVGSKTVNGNHFDSVYKTDDIYFNTTLGHWGPRSRKEYDGWYQTSRPGLNLVLQLNFDRVHNDAYYKLVRPDKDWHPFMNDDHPVLKRRGFTMSWVRLDVDLDAGEVLIEEIQNDWLRDVQYEVKWIYDQLDKRKAKDSKACIVKNSWQEQYITYYEQHLKKYKDVWEEASLNFAISFAVKELGCKHVFYNTFETGNFMKGMDEYYSKPPRSLYTKLPRRFGFVQTEEPPIMLSKEKRLRKKLRTKGLKWYKLTF